MIIDASDRNNPLSIYTHIIDKKTGEDISKKHLIRWYDTKTKRCEYILNQSDASPVVYPDGPEEDCFEAVRCKLRNARAVALVPKDNARFYLEWAYDRDPESVLNRDLDIVIDGPDALKIYIDNLPYETPLQWLKQANTSHSFPNQNYKQ